MSTELTAKVWASQLAAGGKRSVVLGHQMLGVAHIIAENRPLLNSPTRISRNWHVKSLPAQRTRQWWSSFANW